MAPYEKQILVIEEIVTPSLTSSSAVVRRVKIVNLRVKQSKQIMANS